LDKIKIYLGDLSFFDISFNTAVKAYLAYMIGGYLKKIGTKLRPYEIHPGQTDATIKKAYKLLIPAFKAPNTQEIEKALAKISKMFLEIPLDKSEPRPKVAIFGDMYVRDNDVLNQNIINYIEQNGGEVITTPYNEYLKLIVNPTIQRRFKEGFIKDSAIVQLFKTLIPWVDNKFYKYLEPILQEPIPSYLTNYQEIIEKFNIKSIQFGESFDNILKIAYLTKHYKDISLFVQLNPAYCAAALITQAMAYKIEKITGIPVVTIEYDGTNQFKNEAILPYLKFAKDKLKLKHINQE
jgi:predicted nucleotide-binding protein (sugar kinase/HSP70/actin superfamily)